MRKKTLLLLSVSAVFFLSVGVARAFIPLDPNIFKIIHCNNIKNKTEAKIQKLEEKIENHKTAYANAISRFDTLIDRANENGYDTAQLKTDLSILKDKVNKFKEDAQAVIDSLGSLKSTACDKTTNEIKDEVADTKLLMKKVRGDIQDIRSFFKNTIKPDIKQLKNQK